MISRRDFLSRSGLVAAVAAIPQTVRSAEEAQKLTNHKPKNIIHLVADGTSMGTICMADHYSYKVRGRGLTWVALMNNPSINFAWVNMRSLNSLVTDSAAAASSWGSGSRVLNGALNQLPDGTSLKTLYELFSQAGWKRGLVTTTEITHATPAGFAANVDERDTGNMIAVQYLERKIDVLLGGGQKFFSPTDRKDKRNLKSDFSKAGYEVMENLEALKLASIDKPWLGIFDKSHLPFMVDHLNSEKIKARVPTLSYMTTRAIEWLSRYPNFILQVEGGRVDHAAHNCDAPAAMQEMIEFDKAIDVCLEFQAKNPETLIIITVDHGNGNPGLNGMGKTYGQSSWLFANMANFKASFPEIIKAIKSGGKTTTTDEKKDENEKEDEGVSAANNSTSSRSSTQQPPLPEPKRIVEIIQEKTNLPYVSSRRAELFRSLLDKKTFTLYEGLNNENAYLAQLLANYIGVGWGSGSHTSDYVPLIAIGPSSDKFRGFLQNTEVFYNYLAMANIDYKNPTEDLLAYDGKGSDAYEVENVAEYSETDYSALA
ncbi:MAG: alkaline phosphatase [Verrucomicrobiae bacterium]|nr:alkaline phosphatase [Verrucomicrobiae bacterium]